MKKLFHSENSRSFLTVTKSNTAKKLPQFVGAFVATWSALCIGMVLSWTSGAIPLLQKADSVPKITQLQGAWIGSLMTLGAFVGAIPTGTIANKVGRKRTLQLLACPFFASWMIIAFGKYVEAIYAARFLAGLAVGGASVAAPMYVAELAHSSIRGTLGTFFQVQLTVGILIEYILGGFILNFPLLAVVSSTFVVLFLIFVSFLPESPVFLYQKGDAKGATKSLQWFRGNDYNIDMELNEMLEAIKSANENKAQLSDLINCKATLKGLIISLGLMVFQQLSGVNAVLFYTGQIFESTGSAALTPTTSAIIVGAVQVGATMLSTVLIDRAGRKLLLLISDGVMSICLLTLGLYFHMRTLQDLSHLSIIPLASVAIFIIVFSIGFGPIPWMIMGEIFPAPIKGIASSISAAFNWMLAFTVTNQFQNMKNGLGDGITFGIFGIICGVGTVFVACLVPETKGKSVDEVRALLNGKSAGDGKDNSQAAADNSGEKTISRIGDLNQTTTVV